MEESEKLSCNEYVCSLLGQNDQICFYFLRWINKIMVSREGHILGYIKKVTCYLMTCQYSPDGSYYYLHVSILVFK